MDLAKVDIALLEVIGKLSTYQSSVSLMTIDRRLPREYFYLIETGEFKSRVYNLRDNGFIKEVAVDQFILNEKGSKEMRKYRRPFN